MSFSRKIREILTRASIVDQLILGSSLLVISAAVFLALPSILIPLGLPPEGDAVDYRIPLIRWIVHNRTFPNWPWTMVEDYPSLGELLMVPLYILHPSLARLVPILGYLGLGWMSGRIAVQLGGSWSGIGRPALFALGAAWALSFRPVTIQANLLMVDNLASFFLLGSFSYLIDRKIAAAGLFAAMAMATRYSTWGVLSAFPSFILFLYPSSLRWRKILYFCAIAALGPLPFMIRNFLVNDGHLFFPIDAPAVMHSMGMHGYGRGTDLKSFLLLPFDIVYTNSFVNGFFDYTVGKLYMLQLFVGAAVLMVGKAAVVRIGSNGLFAIAFAFIHCAFWFFGNQQLRFLVPALIINVLALLLLLSKQRILLAIITALGLLSVLSVQKDSILMALGRRDSIFSGSVSKARECFARAGVGNDRVGFVKRDGILGFLESDFVFLGSHPYAVPSADADSKGIKWIYAQEKMAGYVPWPSDSPCMLRKEPIEDPPSS